MFVNSTAAQTSQVSDRARRLMASAQGDYDGLRHRFASLSEEHSHLLKAFRLLEKKNEADERHYTTEIAKLEEKLKQCTELELLKQRCDQSSEQFALARLRREVEILKSENERLCRENGELHEECLEKEDLRCVRDVEERRQQREAREKETRLKTHFEERLNSLAASLNDRRREVEPANSCEGCVEVERIRERCVAAEERCRALSEESKVAQERDHATIRDLMARVDANANREFNAYMRHAKLSVEAERYARLCDLKDAQITELTAELRKLAREKLELERGTAERESQMSGALAKGALERGAAVKDANEYAFLLQQRLIEVERKLGDAEGQLSSCKEEMARVTREKIAAEEELRRTNSELRDSLADVKDRELRVRWERDRLLEAIASERYKQQSEGTREAADISKMKEIIVARENEVAEVKKRYRSLLRNLSKLISRVESRLLSIGDGVSEADSSTPFINEDAQWIFDEYVKFASGGD